MCYCKVLKHLASFLALAVTVVLLGHGVDSSVGVLWAIQNFNMIANVGLMKESSR